MSEDRKYSLDEITFAMAIAMAELVRASSQPIADIFRENVEAKIASLREDSAIEEYAEFDVRSTNIAELLETFVKHV